MNNELRTRYDWIEFKVFHFSLSFMNEAYITCKNIQEKLYKSLLYSICRRNSRSACFTH